MEKSRFGHAISTVRTCNIDSEVLNDDIPFTGHYFDPEKHWFVCICSLYGTVPRAEYQIQTRSRFARHQSGFLNDRALIVTWANFV